MIKPRLLKEVFVLLITISLLNYIGNILYLHFYFWWYDVILHFLSGLSLGIMIVFFFSFYSNNALNSQLKTILLAVLFSLFVGIIWEIFELHFGLTSLSDGLVYIRDTASDIIIDVCGGFFGALYARSVIKR
jgi:uncharacterized membrane protein YdcZ (DUF606 family)